jgi:hypothetical protein
VSPWPIFSRTPQDILHLFFIHIVAPDMWFTDENRLIDFG